MTPDWQSDDGAIQLYCADCMDVLPTLGKVDAVITDPPYGIGENARKVRSRGTSSERVKRATIIDYGDFDWDNEPATQEHIESIRSASKWQIIFGGNFFSVPPSSCWLVWDKENTGDFADCELAWTNLRKAVRRLRFHWNGCMRKERDVSREHPTQKPIGVMVWCIDHLPEGSLTICDPFMGSGTTGIACIRTGRRFIGIEKAPTYFKNAVDRIKRELAQMPLPFEKTEPMPETPAFL